MCYYTMSLCVITFFFCLEHCLLFLCYMLYLHQIQKEAYKCCCHKAFQILRVGEGKYTFGNSKIVRLVRIHGSSIVVRVGGGWEFLYEFLKKCDPCRGKNMYFKQNTQAFSWGAVVFICQRLNVAPKNLPVIMLYICSSKRHLYHGLVCLVANVLLSNNCCCQVLVYNIYVGISLLHE